MSELHGVWFILARGVIGAPRVGVPLATHPPLRYALRFASTLRFAAGASLAHTHYALSATLRATLRYAPSATLRATLRFDAPLRCGRFALRISYTR